MDRLLSLVLVYVSLIISCEGFEYIVAPTNAVDYECIEESTECHDLSYYASHSDTYFTSDSTLTFLPGTHVLDHNEPIVISDVSNLTLLGDGEVQNSTVVTCNGTSSGFLFRNFDALTISGLVISQCGFVLSDSLVSYVSQKFNYLEHVSPSVSSVFMFNGTNLLIQDSSIQYGIGYGLTIVNVFTIYITHSSFIDNNADCVKLRLMRSGGNVRILYTSSTHCPAPNKVNDTSYVSVKDVLIAGGGNCGEFSVDSLGSIRELTKDAGGGLTFITHTYQCGLLGYIIEDTTILGNQGIVGSNLMFVGLPVPTYIGNFNCSFGKGQVIGGGVTVIATFSHLQGTNNNFTVFNSTFIANDKREGYAGTGTAFVMVIFADESYQQVTMDSCTFLNNKGVSTVRIEQNNQIPVTRRINLHLSNVYFRDNGEFTLRGTYDFTGALILININNAFATNLSVINTQCPGIQLIGSSLSLTGDILLQNNSYKSGGGVILRASSYLIFKPPTRVSFINNHAFEYGGAIYIPLEGSDIFFSACFFQIDDLTFQPDPDIVINAVNNTAGLTGDFLSGGNLGVCYLVDAPALNLFEGNGNSYSYFLDFVHPKPFPGDYRYVVSESIGAIYCFPDNSFQISFREVETPIEFYQGQLFNISIAGICPVGVIFPSRLNINLYNCTNKDFECFDHDNAMVVRRWQVNTGLECTNVPIVITGDEFTRDLVLEFYTDVRVPYDLLPPLHIHLRSADCPPGFTKDDVCVCDKYLSSLEGVSCDINTTSITTSGNRKWVGYDSSTNETLYALLCPLEYCKDDEVTFNLIDSPDDQCAYNRAGIACGECADGYSLLLGGDECGKCSNYYYLSLLLVFGAAGIILVALLLILNLTVSVGTVNGLIFFANVIKINEKAIFNPSISPGYLLIFRPFVSFINLDFGFKVCFYDGLNAEAKFWLQFVFPFYIWLIIGILMVFCRYSTKLSELLGNNTVKVLATLFLLSYTKIVFTVFHVFNGLFVYRNGTRDILWTFDTSIKNLSTEHILGLIMFCFVFFLLILPYSTLLIILPCINRLFFPSIRRFFLLLKPFTDAYAGPFKDSHQYWLGLLLLTRLILIICSNFVRYLLTQYITIVFLVLLLTLGYNLRGPYKANYLNILESWFLALLLLLVIFSLSDQELVLVIGGGICLFLSLLTMLCIIIYHIRMQLIHYGIVAKLKRFFPCEKEQNSDSRSATPSTNEIPLDTIEESVELEDSFDQSSAEFQENIEGFKKIDFSRFRDSIFSNM